MNCIAITRKCSIPRDISLSNWSDLDELSNIKCKQPSISHWTLRTRIASISCSHLSVTLRKSSVWPFWCRGRFMFILCYTWVRWNPRSMNASMHLWTDLYEFSPEECALHTLKKWLKNSQHWSTSGIYSTSEKVTLAWKSPYEGSKMREDSWRTYNHLIHIFNHAMPHTS